MASLPILEILAEQRIAEAMRQGGFDGLPGAGCPLVFDDEPFVSEEQRMLNRVLKNAGFTPPEVALRKEIAELRNQHEAAQGEVRELLRQRLAWLSLRLVALRK